MIGMVRYTGSKSRQIIHHEEQYRQGIKLDTGIKGMQKRQRISGKGSISFIVVFVGNESSGDDGETKTKIVRKLCPLIANECA